MHREVFDFFLDNLNRYDKLILVEGKKDKKGLEGLGVGNEIISIAGRSHFQVIEEIASKSKQIIILTDFDKEGKKLYGNFSKGLSRFGVKVDRYYREWLQVNTRLCHIESIEKFFPQPLNKISIK